MKALIIGATGATGKDLVQTLLLDDSYHEVVIFVRQPSGITHPKLKEIQLDFENPSEISGLITGDVLFSCLGTTFKAAGSRKKQWYIDYEIPLRFAMIAKRNGIGSIVLLSSYGASVKSNMFYLQVKGALEHAISGLRFPRSIIFRPGFLERKDTNRVAERFSVTLLHVLNGMGLFSKFKPIPTHILAEKMAKAAKTKIQGQQIIELNRILEL